MRIRKRETYAPRRPLCAQGSALADLTNLSLFILTRLTSRRIFLSCAAYSGGYRPGAPSSSPQKTVALPLTELKSAAPASAVRSPWRHAAALPSATAAANAQATTATSALTRLRTPFSSSRRCAALSIVLS